METPPETVWARTPNNCPPDPFDPLYIREALQNGLNLGPYIFGDQWACHAGNTSLGPLLEGDPLREIFETGKRHYLFCTSEFLTVPQNRGSMAPSSPSTLSSFPSEARAGSTSIYSRLPRPYGHP
jgi:hypothetical protein